MGDRSMAECLTERLDEVRKYLAIGPTNGSFRKWYDNGADLASALLPLNRTEGAALANAWGYLEGAADMADLTVMELLGQYAVSLNPPTRKHKKGS